MKLECIKSKAAAKLVPLLAAADSLQAEEKRLSPSSQSLDSQQSQWDGESNQTGLQPLQNTQENIVCVDFFHPSADGN